MGRPDSPIPSWVNKWLLASSVICLYDGLFCVLRPHSLPGGCLEMLFYGYRIYTKADKNYANTEDVFIFTQGLGNLVECVCGFLVVFNVLKNIRASKMLAITVSIMTFWKSVLFGVYSLEIPKGGHVVESWVYEIAVCGPTFLWIVLPGYSAYILIQDFLHEKRSVNSSISTKAPAGSDADDSESETEDNQSNSVPNREPYNLRNRQS